MKINGKEVKRDELLNIYVRKVNDSSAAQAGGYLPKPCF